MRDSDGNWIDTTSAWYDPKVFDSQPELPKEYWTPQDTTEMDRKFAELLEDISK